MTLTELIDALEAMADAPSDEGPAFTQLDHALQCALEVSERAPGDNELQIAGLVHDIGAFLGATDEAHGRAGASAVRAVLGDRVARLVEAHVPAKRYLVAVDARYTLTDVSHASLVAQGGPMTPAEVAAFAADPICDAAVALRRADEAAKSPGRDVPGLGHWLPLVRQLSR